MVDLNPRMEISFTGIFVRSAIAACFAEVKLFLVGSDFIGDVSLVKMILATLITVRLQAEGKLPTGIPRRYSGALNAYIDSETGFTDNVLTHLLAGLGAGLFAVCIGSSTDVVKSRMMEDTTYKSTLDCFIKTLKNEFAFYKGFLPNFGRLGSWNAIMFLTLEQVKKFLRREV